MFSPTVLSLHQEVNLPWVFVIDDVHYLYIGITKQLIGLWFDSSYRRNNFCISKDASKNYFKFELIKEFAFVNEKLFDICVPDCISSMPKSGRDC